MASSREGKEVWTGQSFPAVKQIAGGVITLGEQTTPGEYFLQLTARHKNTTAVTWIDFELLDK